MLYNKSNNRHALYIAVLFGIIVLVPVFVFAKGGISKKPVGGKVIADKKTLAALVVCTKLNGPFSIKAFNNAPSGSTVYYASELNTKDTRIGAYMIGLYDTVKDTESCKNPETDAPVTVYRTYPFGSSK